MRISSAIDNSQFNDEGEISAYADSYFSELAERKQFISTQICIIKGKINEKLQERRRAAYENVVTITKSAEYVANKIYDSELKCFESAARIYEIEYDEQDYTVFDSIEYVDDFEKIYNQLIFYFRRIQFGMQGSNITDLLKFLRTERLSVYVPVTVLYDSSLGNKEKIAAVLADMYYEQGGVSEAVYIICMAMEKAAPEYLDMLEEKRLKMTENL